MVVDIRGKTYAWDREESRMGWFTYLVQTGPEHGHAPLKHIQYTLYIFGWHSPHIILGLNYIYYQITLGIL